MKIMQILHYPGRGGAEKYAYLLAKYAKKEGHETIFVFGQDGPMVNKIQELGCEIKFLKMRSPFDPEAIIKLSNIYKHYKPDVVQTHFLRENFIAIAASKITPVKSIFSTVHRIEPKTKTQAYFNKLYANNLSKFIAVSEISKDYLINEGISERKIAVIPNGAEILPFNKTRVREEFDITSDTKMISCVGRLTKEKGQGVLLKAFARVKTTNNILVLVGEGELFEKMKNLAKRLDLEDRVIFTGGRDNGYQVIGASDIYIQPSEIENLSIATLEAMLQRIPIIATDIPSFRALLGSGRGILFKPKDINGLVIKLDQALADSNGLKKQSKKSYDYAKERFTAMIMWQKTKALYEHNIRVNALKN